MKYTINGINKNIPDKDLEKIINGLSVTQDEAIQIWLEDEGILHNAEQEALEQKAKDNHILREVHDALSEEQIKKRMSGTTTPRKRTVKEQPDKTEIINNIITLLTEKGCENIVTENPTKLISFVYNGNPYKINLTATRTKSK